MILIGSKALWLLGHHDREPADVDIIGTDQEYRDIIKLFKNIMILVKIRPQHDGRKFHVQTPSFNYEFEVAWPGSTAEQVRDFVLADPETQVINTYSVPSLDFLYALKLSHRYRKNSKHFLKTMADIRLMRRLGAKLRPEHEEILRLREEEIAALHPKLNVSKKEFFVPAGSVKYVYDHDTLHEAMKHLEKPAYNYFKPLVAEVMTDRRLFERLPLKTRCYAVLEEAYVLALERSQIPYGDSVDPFDSFKIALEKVCTSITSGWFREFAWEHYEEILAMYDSTYVERFKQKIAEGVVKKLDGLLAPVGDAA